MGYKCMYIADVHEIDTGRLANLSRLKNRLRFEYLQSPVEHTVIEL